MFFARLWVAVSLVSVVEYLCVPLDICKKLLFMKKIISVIVLMVSIFSSAVFATEPIDRNTEFLKKTIKKEFPDAEVTDLKKVGESDLYLVSCVSNQQSLLVYIDTKGIIACVARRVEKSSLPLAAVRTIDAVFGFTNVKIAYELLIDSATSYLVTITGEKRNIDVRVFSSGGYEIVRKHKPHNLIAE
jgi:hypothetical protein